MRKKSIFFIVTTAIVFSTYLTRAEDISTKPTLDDDEDDDFVVQPIVILGPDGRHMPAPGNGGPPSFGQMTMEVHGHVEEIVGQRKDGTLFYQKKVIEEGPGFVHMSVMQSDAPPSLTQGSSLLEGEPGAVPLSAEDGGPERFFNMMSQVMQAIHQQQVAAFMSQVMNQGGGFILALVEDDDEDEDGSSTALAPYTGGFLSEGFGSKDDTQTVSNNTTTQVNTATNTTNKTSKDKPFSKGPKPKHILLILILGTVVAAIVGCTLFIIRLATGKGKDQSETDQSAAQRKKQPSFAQSLTKVVTGTSPTGPGKLD